MNNRSKIVAGFAAAALLIVAFATSSASAAPGGKKSPKPTATATATSTPTIAPTVPSNPSPTTYVLTCSRSLDGTVVASYGPVTGDPVYLTYTGTTGGQVAVAAFDSGGFVAGAKVPLGVNVVNATLLGNAEYGDASVVLTSCTL